MPYCTTQVVKKGHLNRFFTNYLRNEPRTASEQALAPYLPSRGQPPGMLPPMKWGADRQKPDN